jgi:hypothetical protein
MTLKELDVELKSIVDKYLKIIPTFNTGDFLIDFVSRNKYTTENKDFLNEINTVVDFYLTDKNDLTMREKEQWMFIKKYHLQKYQYGINSPGAVDVHAMIFSNQ